MSHVSTLVMHRSTKGMTELYRAKKEMYQARTKFLRAVWAIIILIGWAAAVYTWVKGWDMWQSLGADLAWTGLKYKVMMFFN